MANEETTKPKKATKAPTEYRVFKLQGDAPLDDEGGVSVELYALLPNTFTGNAAKAAAETYGVGTYIAVPKSSAKPRVAEVTEPKLRVR